MAEFKIGNKIYQTKGEARKFYQNLLYKDIKMSRIPRLPWGMPFEDENKKAILDLIEFHPDKEDVIGCGARSIICIEDAEGSSCFAVVRVDGSVRNFSYHACFDKNADVRAKIQVLRDLVEHDVATKLNLCFDDNRIIIKCPLQIHFKCEKNITLSTCHADHTIPMFKLVEKFLVIENLSLKDIKLDRQGKISFYNTLSDTDLGKRWIKFHEETAEIQATCKFCNMSKGKSWQIHQCF